MKKVPTVKKPEKPEAKGIHVIIDILIKKKKKKYSDVLKWNRIKLSSLLRNWGQKRPYCVSINFNALPLTIGSLFLTF